MFLVATVVAASSASHSLVEATVDSLGGVGAGVPPLHVHVDSSPGGAPHARANK